MKNLPPEVEARVIAAGEAALLAAGVHPSQAGEFARQGLALILAVSYELEIEVRAAAYEPDTAPLAPDKQAIHDTIEASYAAARAAEAAKAVERGWGSPAAPAPSAYEVPEADHLKIADLPPPIDGDAEPFAITEVATGYTLDDGRTPVVDPGLGIEVRPAPISSLDAEQEAGTLAARRLITPAGTGDVSILDRPKDNEPE